MILKPLKKRICKECKVRYQPDRPLQGLCSPKCAYEYQKKLRQKQIAKQEKDEEKAIDDTVKAMKVNTHSKERKKDLQDEINKLARNIDCQFGYNCIDCQKPFVEHQIDACHLISRGSNTTLSRNLHNLHSGHNHCNFYNPIHESNYKRGLVLRYGNDYLEMVEGLPLQHPEIHLNNVEITEKLALVRKINRTFNTYNFIDGKSAREVLNKIIGIYK